MADSNCLPPLAWAILEMLVTTLLLVGNAAGVHLGFAFLVLFAIWLLVLASGSAETDVARLRQHLLFLPSIAVAVASQYSGMPLWPEVLLGAAVAGLASLALYRLASLLDRRASQE